MGYTIVSDNKPSSVALFTKSKPFLAILGTYSYTWVFPSVRVVLIDYEYNVLMILD